MGLATAFLKQKAHCQSKDKSADVGKIGGAALVGRAERTKTAK